MLQGRPAQPGFFTATEIIGMEDYLRLHLNENPYGPPPGTVEAVHTEAAQHLNRYPDSECGLLRERLAEHFRVAPEMIAIGNGTDELVLLASMTFLREPGSRVVTTDSTFPGYVTSAAAVGAPAHVVPLAGAALPVAGLTAAVRQGAALAFVCNPLNPTGALLDRDEVTELIDAAESSGTVLVFDEAYLDFAGPAHEFALEAVREGRRVLVTRTFSKAWGLASVRAGLALGPPQLVEQIAATARALPFNVNRPAQRAVLRALEAPAHLDRVRADNARVRELLFKTLDSLGLGHSPSAANFVMVEVPGQGTGPGDSTRFAARLAEEHHILVRDLTLLGLPGRLRVSVGTEAEVERLAAALAHLLGRH
ncbi:histidinol-phosphate aminotransferase family protein [Streptomyces diacarni]|uniref:histidinol-phosphate transaminase n=1 Tax=Streptomyces diacarni TaxID=2800381 RepID=A0A367ENT6_9ACTN|nr:histidinol-phosphate transaminase [Streptomyces diacarni]RCG19758.1 histidinol-phosphate aminotransferase family protein [Streptomyces diacarni]